MRLNQYLARNSDLSRREADEVISAGRVLVNNKTGQLGQQVNPVEDETRLDNAIIKPQPLVYIALNKPVGYISSRQKQGTRPTLYELLPTELRGLKTAGRLDQDSSGLIILTNDGNFALQLTHPSFTKIKTYQITLDRFLSPEHKLQLKQGVP